MKHDSEWDGISFMTWKSICRVDYLPGVSLLPHKLHWSEGIWHPKANKENLVDQSVYKKPETKKEFPWHQDNGYTPIEPEQYLTCWIALEDATIENGCIWIMPGTHKQGVIEHIRTETGLLCYFGKEKGIPVPLKKGGVAVFSSLLFHKSGVNVSDTIRKGYIVQYTTIDAISKKTGERLNGPVFSKNGERVK